MQACGHKVARIPSIRVFVAVSAIGIALLSGLDAAQAAERDTATSVSAIAAESAESGLVVAEYAAVAIDEIPLRAAPEPSDESSGPRIVTRGGIEKGQALASSLAAKGISASTVHVIAREMRPLFNFRFAQPGHRYRLTQNPDGSLHDFRYWTTPEESFHLWFEHGGFKVRAETTPLLARVVRIGGVVTTSLYDAVVALGEQPRFAGDFADLFAWDIDFSRTVRPGDEFQALYERLYRIDPDGEEEYVRPGRILAARYAGESGEHETIYFEDGEGTGSYFRPDGTSVERAFLAAPMSFSRITSHFSSARKHPILNVTRPHHGIDYAAPKGTPIFSVADGTVIYRGWGGGFGNLIKIRHANGYVSYYSHLSGFAKGLRTGQKVGQRQVIGFVGKTGLATGPHVCFRISKDGHYVNPLKIKSPAGRPVPDDEWVDFQLVRDTLLADLDGGSLVATEDAL